MPPKPPSQALDPTVLMVSKPVGPPWTDSSKNLVRDLAQAGRALRYRVLTPRGFALEGARVVSEPIYRDIGSYTPPLLQNLSALRRLLRRDDSALAHFFFAPNPRSAAAARLGLRLHHRRTVQTICSVPRSFDRLDKVLFGERIIALSQHTRRRLLAGGIAPERVTHIPPAIVVPATPTAAERAAARRSHGLLPDDFVVIYPGDYQFSQAAKVVAEAVSRLPGAQVRFVFACRIKQAASRLVEREIDADLRRAGVRARVSLLNEVPRMLELLAASDVCVLPAESLYAKMDLPLVLLEAMALELPIVVAAGGPLEELGCGREVGAVIPPNDAAALAGALAALHTDHARRRQVGTTARAVVEEHFSIGAVSRQHEQLYRELLATP
ncbi:MAG: glycosyltransferase family 4 protein [Proteobacteria bacterium]|nr:glycosyltransferase family 4 protein [Pseudomonadota bacterium]